VDIATNLIEQARQRAAGEGLAVKFQEGDAEDLPFGDAEFDVVITMFGAMFAPRPERTAAELLRVCKPGGVVAMANWTPEGFIGKTFRATAQLAPPPLGVLPPVLWGDENVVKQRFSSGVADLKSKKYTVSFKYPFPPEKVVALFREYFGPTMMTYSRLDAAGQSQLTAVLESLWREHNLAGDGSTSVEGEYLEVRVVPA
jgi:ubiquinone/menaquinone biosynthesis C-methylase UbiE